ncbi:MAG: serine hydrolase domain-containing protein [Pseudomonadota bacterium]
MSWRFLSLGCVALCWSLVSQAWAEGTTRATADFELALDEIGRSSDIVGLAVAVVRAGEIESIRTFGARSVEDGDLVDPDTVFRLASLSKGIAASAVGQMVKDRRVSLSTRVSTFSPTLRLKNKNSLEQLTLEHVLSHRTGLPPYAYDNLLEAGVPPATIRGRFVEVDPICAVGSCYAYQNVVFDTVTKLVESVDGETYSAAMRKRLFNPLGMSRASVSVEGLRADDNWARPYRRRRNGPWQLVEVKDAYYGIPAAGGVNASITDMAAWLQAQMGYRADVLSDEVLAMIHAPRVKTLAEFHRIRDHFPDLQDAHYGLGWRIYSFGEHRVVSHFGSVDYGYGAQITFIPARDVGIVTLTNSRSKEFGKILPAFLAQELADDG